MNKPSKYFVAAPAILLLAFFPISFSFAQMAGEQSVRKPSDLKQLLPESGALLNNAKIQDEMKDHHAFVFGFEGNVRILKRNADEWAPAEKGQLLEEGDQILTLGGSHLDVAYDNSFLNIARIEADTKAEFRSIEPTDLHMEDGTIFSALGGLAKGSQYQVSTPTAVAGVRGTELFTSASGGSFDLVSVVQDSNPEISYAGLTFFDGRPEQTIEENHYVTVQGNDVSFHEGATPEILQATGDFHTDVDPLQGGVISGEEQPAESLDKESEDKKAGGDGNPPNDQGGPGSSEGDGTLSSEGSLLSQPPTEETDPAKPEEKNVEAGALPEGKQDPGTDPLGLSPTPPVTGEETSQGWEPSIDVDALIDASITPPDQVLEESSLDNSASPPSGSLPPQGLKKKTDPSQTEGDSSSQGGSTNGTSSGQSGSTGSAGGNFPGGNFPGMGMGMGAGPAAGGAPGSAAAGFYPDPNAMMRFLSLGATTYPGTAPAAGDPMHDPMHETYFNAATNLYANATGSDAGDANAQMYGNMFAGAAAASPYYSPFSSGAMMNAGYDPMGGMAYGGMPGTYYAGAPGTGTAAPYMPGSPSYTSGMAAPGYMPPGMTSTGMAPGSAAASYMGYGMGAGSNMPGYMAPGTTAMGPYTGGYGGMAPGTYMGGGMGGNYTGGDYSDHSMSSGSGAAGYMGAPYTGAAGMGMMGGYMPPAGDMSFGAPGSAAATMYDPAMMTGGGYMGGAMPGGMYDPATMTGGGYMGGAMPGGMYDPPMMNAATFTAGSFYDPAAMAAANTTYYDPSMYTYTPPIDTYVPSATTYTQEHSQTYPPPPTSTDPTCPT